MVKEKSLQSEPLNVQEALDYLKNCDLMEIKEGKYTKSIYFKDINDNLSAIIYSLANGSSTILASIRGENYTFNLDKEEFVKLFNKHRIFMKK